MERNTLCNPTIRNRVRESFHNPRIADGSYLSPEHIAELQRNSEIRSIIDLKEPEYIEGVGTLRRMGVVTRQGYGHAVLASVPEYPRSDLCMLVAETPALTIGIDGFSRETVVDYTRDGHYYVMFGAEGSYKPPNQPLAESAISVSDSAAAMISFTKEWAELLIQEGHTVDPNRMMFRGSSRGGIHSIGALALSKHFGVSAAYANHIAPRFPEKLTASEVKDIISQVITEAPHVLTLPFRLGFKRSLRYANSLDADPYALLHHVQIAAAIASAELGRLSEDVDTDQLMDNVFFTKDGSHEKKAWDKKLGSFSSTTNRYIPGRHMDIPLKHVQYPARMQVNAVATCNNLGHELTPDNIKLMHEELLHLRHPIGRRALQIAV